MDQFGNTHCIVFKNGSVLWVPPAKLTSFCSMDLKHWPQDEQSCFFVFGSWTYDTLQIYIDKGNLYETDTNVKTRVHRHTINILRVIFSLYFFNRMTFMWEEANGSWLK